MLLISNMLVNQIILQGESDVVEFKLTFGKAVVESLCAFANHRGGMVLIGVANDGKILGVSCSDETMQTWVNEIKQNTVPSIIPDPPTHAAMLLFGKNDPPYALHIGRFKTASTIIDDRMFRGTLFGVVDEAMKFISSHVKVAFEITGEIQRREIPEYPPAALRELLLNAVVHRDYTSPTDIQIRIFDNAVTFFNPGRLYGDLTIEQLKTDSYQSRTRNKLIAEAFYLTRDIEKYGSGYIRVRREIAAYPTMHFSYEESGDGYLVTLNYIRQKLTSVDVPAEGISEGIKRVQLNIQNCPGQRLPQISGALKVPAKTVERWLAELKGKGRIEFRGSKKTGGYYVRTTHQA
jgi:ATP-dependent DNA helicase RecG